MNNMNSDKSPAITVNAIIQQGNKVFFIRRKKEPFKNKISLPGGFVNYNETVEEAVTREILEEGIHIFPIHILGVYSDPKRDPRKHTISVAFICIIISGEAKASDDTKDIEWINIDKKTDQQYAFDHNIIINDYIKWRHSEGTYWSFKRRED